jgi:hypothetical protein
VSTRFRLQLFTYFGISGKPDKWPEISERSAILKRKTMRNLLTLIALIASLPAWCQGAAPAPQSLGQAGWLQGSWKGMTKTGPFYEAWRVINDSTLLNLAIEIKGGDTLIKESATLSLRQGSIWLGGEPARWKASRVVAGEIVLRNDTLRFSNTIIWMHTPEDHWITILEHPHSTVFYDMSRDAALDRKVEAWIRERARR